MDPILHYSSMPSVDGSPHHSITSTQYALPTCEAKPNGVCCWHHAEIEYVTSQNITKHLCKACYNRLWSVTLAWHHARKETLDAEERCRAVNDVGGHVA